MSEVVVVKHAPAGRVPAEFRYTARRKHSPPGWIAVQARWTLHEVIAGPLRFAPGDVLDEFFALERPYNAFAIHRESGEFGGWYCNVTEPTRVEHDEIHWHDLYVDVLVTPAGEISVEDEDELEASGLAHSDPDLHAMILAARDELIELIERHRYPFCTVS
jgi:hypothetical protein